MKKGIKVTINIIEHETVMGRAYNQREECISKIRSLIRNLKTLDMIEIDVVEELL